MPGPGDVQTANAGASIGEAETGDSITFTFTGAVPPSLVLAAWSGAATAVTVYLNHAGATTLLSIQDSGGSTLTALGSVDLGAHYSTGTDVTFTNSTMTASGSTITVVLGSAVGSPRTVSVPSTMVWTASGTSINESGLPDVEF
jgi:chitinase